MLDDKATRYGRVMHHINRWFPSSQVCHVCGRGNEPKPLSIRTWPCPCEATHDQDLNTAKNTLAAGHAEKPNACGETISPST